MAGPKHLTLDDFLKCSPEERLELIDGRIVQKASPSGEHSDVENAIGALIRRHFRKPAGPGGSGGWWIQTEPTVYYPKHERVFTHDIAGWRRSRTPENPKGYPIRETPDWVCEVSFSTWRKDSQTVPETLSISGVPFYWIADVERQALMAFELMEGGRYGLIGTFFRTDTGARIPPFDAVPLSVDEFFGADPAE